MQRGAASPCRITHCAHCHKNATLKWISLKKVVNWRFRRYAIKSRYHWPLSLSIKDPVDNVFDNHLKISFTSIQTSLRNQIYLWNISSPKMAIYRRLSFITKYLVLVIAMAILPTITWGFSTHINNSSMIAFHEGKGLKEGIARGM